MITAANARRCAFCHAPLYIDGGGVIWINGLEYHTLCTQRLQTYGTGPLTENDVRRIVREELNTKAAPEEALTATFDPYRVTWTHSTDEERK